MKIAKKRLKFTREKNLSAFVTTNMDIIHTVLLPNAIFLAFNLYANLISTQNIQIKIFGLPF